MENTNVDEVQVENVGEQVEKIVIQKKESKQLIINTWLDTILPEGNPEERSKAIDQQDINDFYAKMLEIAPNWSQKGNEKGVKLHWSWYRSNYKKTHGLPRRKVNRLKNRLPEESVA